MDKNKNRSQGKDPADPSLKELVIGGAVYLTRLNTKFENRRNWERPDDRKVTAVIPGTVQKIMVEEGTEVDQGTPLLILEAMKMRNEVNAPRKGMIKKIYVSENEQVAKKQLLLEIS